MIHITTPPTYTPERHYILDIIFQEFLGISYTHDTQDTYPPQITLQIGDHTLTLPDTFFQIPATDWLQNDSLPTTPLTTWPAPSLLEPRLCAPTVPIIYGAPLDDTRYDIPIDIFGSAFFMLARYEEVAQPHIRDIHHRFPATASLAYQAGFLDRPIINEYLEILWHFIQKIAPSLQRKHRHFQIIPSHDVDSPYLYPFRTLLQMGKLWAYECLSRTVTPDANGKRKWLFKGFTPAIQFLPQWTNWARAKRGNLQLDPHNTFDFLMDVSEKSGVMSRFYFITDQTSNGSCGDYDFQHPLIGTLLQHIHNRGHEIGLHPSFNTYANPSQIKKEYLRLRDRCDQLGISQTAWGGRQHLLKWQAPDTWQHWEDAGLDYDTTLSFADHAGFRCGVCYDYPVFNLHTRQILNLRESPLIVMEVTVIEPRYMNLGHTQVALDYMNMLKSRCKLFEGDFTILWHNSFFKEPQDRMLYKDILSVI